LPTEKIVSVGVAVAVRVRPGIRPERRVPIGQVRGVDHAVQGEVRRDGGDQREGLRGAVDGPVQSIGERRQIDRHKVADDVAGRHYLKPATGQDVEPVG
jgi:hypothetical protein